MSYASAAHHAPTTSDPTPNSSLLVTPDETLNPDARHVKVAASEEVPPPPTVVPQKRESSENQTSSASTGSNGAVGGGKKSGKKGKKNKKDTPTKDVETSPEDGQKKGEDRREPSEQHKVQATEEKPEKDEVTKPDKEQVSNDKKDDKKEAETKKEESKKQAETSSSSSSSSSSEDNNEKDKTNKEPAGEGFETQVKGDADMEKRPTVSKDLDQKLVDPYVPRANIAATVEHPNGTTENDYAKTHKDESVLQQHVAFFDRDNDGIIWPHDTFVGFHRLGYSLIWCILSVFLIHPTFSFFTLKSWFPDPFFRIRIDKIHRARHGSDTGVYDSQGRFVSAKFEEIFEKFDKGKKGGLTFIEGLMMIRENRNVLDPIGWIGAFFEWFASYLLIWPKNGIVMKEDLRTIYDGSLFYAVAEKEETVRARQHRFYSGLFKENRSDDIKKFNKKIQ